jgi:hypothetical protein
MKTEIIKFHEDELIAYKQGDQIFVAVRPIINALGVHGDWALKSIKSDEILRDVHCVRMVHDASGRAQNMVCLPIHHVHGWLFSIQINKVKPEIREKLLLYKKECYRVLYDHFYGSYHNVKNNIIDRSIHHKRLNKIDRLINMLKNERRREELIIENIDKANYAQFELFPDQKILAQ